MLYRLRRDDGTADPFSAGTLVEADGRAIRLAVHDFVLEPQGEWRSPIDGTAYPAAWRVQVPAHALDLTVTPVLPEQELNLTVRYWEGAVDVAGTIRGRGYLEMTGYSSRHSSASRSAF
jgi:predicted secreted hydrolase